jgi:LPXTG-motif cell wall-anchored protein
MAAHMVGGTHVTRIRFSERSWRQRTGVLSGSMAAVLGVAAISIAVFAGSTGSANAAPPSSRSTVAPLDEVTSTVSIEPGPSATGNAERACPGTEVVGFVNATGLYGDEIYTITYKGHDLDDAESDDSGNANFTFDTNLVPPTATTMTIDVTFTRETTDVAVPDSERGVVTSVTLAVPLCSSESIPAGSESTPATPSAPESTPVSTPESTPASGSSSSSGGSTTSSPTSSTSGSSSSSRQVVVTVTPNSVAPGDTVDVVGTGFNPGETVDAVLHSTPTSLGSFTANSAGRVAFSFSAPATSVDVTHTVILTGESSLLSGFGTFDEVVGSGVDGGVANTGTDSKALLVTGLLLLVVGVGFVVGARRREPHGH